MNRRRALRVAGAGSVAALSGCLSRVTGWSSLRIIVNNGDETGVKLTVTIHVDTATYQRQFELSSGESRTVEADVDVPYGADLRYVAEREASDEPKTFETTATTALWGGNKCTFEPVIEISEHSWSVGPSCIA